MAPDDYCNRYRRIVSDGKGDFEALESAAIFQPQLRSEK